MAKHKATLYDVPQNVLDKIAELEAKYGFTSEEFRAKERRGNEVVWNGETHWWGYWIYNILPGNKAYHVDNDFLRRLWAEMEQQGDKAYLPPIVFKFKDSLVKREQVTNAIPDVLPFMD